MDTLSNKIANLRTESPDMTKEENIKTFDSSTKQCYVN